MSYKKLTSGYCREYFEQKIGCNYNYINGFHLVVLESILKTKLKLHNDFSEYKMNVCKDGFKFNISPKNGKLENAFINVDVSTSFINVDSSNGSNREGISFNRDGFIGFSGWASTNNSQPFYKAFIKWVDIMNNSKLIKKQ